MSKLIALSVMLIASVAGDHPISIYRDFEELELPEDAATTRNNEQYRLPQNVIPLDYDIYIDLYFAERTDRPYSYDGKEYIIIKVVIRLY